MPPRRIAPIPIADQDLDALRTAAAAFRRAAEERADIRREIRQIRNRIAVSTL